VRHGCTLLGKEASFQLETLYMYSSNTISESLAVAAVLFMEGRRGGWHNELGLANSINVTLHSYKTNFKKNHTSYTPNVYFKPCHSRYIINMPKGSAAECNGSSSPV
jgi:hypothetical protein